MFDDPLHPIPLDPYEDEEQWRAIGSVGPVCLLVIQTIWPEGTEPGGRIISARKATRDERSWYEDGD